MPNILLVGILKLMWFDVAAALLRDAKCNTTGTQECRSLTECPDTSH